MATFTPAAQRVRADYNYVSAFDVHKPDVDSVLTQRYGYGLLSDILDMVGSSKGTSSLEYSHHEADRLMPKVRAQVTFGGGTTNATFTMEPIGTPPNNPIGVNPADPLATQGQTGQASPYIGATTNDMYPIRQNDLILIKPVAGVVSASTYVRAFVHTVDVAAGTFEATVLNSGEVIPNITAYEEIFIYGNAFGEGSAQPKGRQTRTLKFSNQLQIIKDTHEITGSENDIVLWFETRDPMTGQMGYTWGIKGESDTLMMFLNYRESTMLIGDSFDNLAIQDNGAWGQVGAAADRGTPIAMTEGLIPFILSQGNVSNYSGITGWTLQDAEDLVKELDKQKGSKENMMLCGINLSLQVDQILGDRFAEGAISYGNFQFSQDKAVDLAFSKFKVGEYVFHKKTYDAFNDLQTFGADGYGFPNEGMVIPMDNRVDAMSRESIPSLRKRYLVNPDTGESRELKSTPVDLFKVGDQGRDAFETRYMSHCGFEGFAGNRFAYIKRA